MYIYVYVLHIYVYARVRTYVISTHIYICPYTLYVCSIHVYMSIYVRVYECTFVRLNFTKNFFYLVGLISLSSVKF